MINPTAFLVEDESESADYARKALESAGFEVEIATDYDSASNLVQPGDITSDLYVLDRRIPFQFEDQPQDIFGDQLFQDVRNVAPDSFVIVFTGFGDLSQSQKVYSGSGQLRLGRGTLMDRVYLLQKHQTVEFENRIEEIALLYKRMKDIEVRPFASGELPLNEESSRALRRLALEYGAVSVKARSLKAGLSGADVWECELRDTSGPIASVVAKTVENPGGNGGLSELLPSQLTTLKVNSVTGLLRGKTINVLQNAGTTTVPLSKVLEDDPCRAGNIAVGILTQLVGVHSRETVLDLAAVCCPILSWARLTDLLKEFSIPVPSAETKVTVQLGRRHGDLHAENILVENDLPVLIDFDDELEGSWAIDPITLLISTLTHPDSPVPVLEWPTSEEVESFFLSNRFGSESKYAEWFSSIYDFMEDNWGADREVWAVVLAYSVRQLKYNDVRSNSAKLDRVLAITKLSVRKLGF